MPTEVIIFWILALVTLISGLGVVLMKNPIHCALSLVLTMIGLSGLFYNLNAPFIAGVQLIVYAGAVLVLFVMVLMLFDVKKESRAFSRGLLTGALKIGSVGVLAGLVAGSIYMSVDMIQEGARTEAVDALQTPTQNLATMLFTQYVFGFEALGVLLLIVAIGCIALARSRGGTHDIK